MMFTLSQSACEERSQLGVVVVDRELLGLYEVADLAGVSRTVVANWRVRDPRFPRAVADLRSGPVFRSPDIRIYLRRRKKGYMPYVISTINLKGGVGKTTLTAGLGELLSGEFGKRVLLIDLDPQTNLTTSLIGEKRWKKLNDEGRTLETLFRDALRSDTDPPVFDLSRTLQKNVSPVQEVRTVDLLPSSLDLIDLQDRLGSTPPGRYYARNPIDLLSRATKSVMDNYEYVLIDCPPNLGLITFNGLKMSDGFVIPTIPDVLSTYGIPQIQGRVRSFASEAGVSIAEVGIVVSKYRAQSSLHNTTLRELRRKNDPPVFDSIIPEGSHIAESADHVTRGTLRQKYNQDGYKAMRAVAAEFITRVEDLA